MNDDSRYSPIQVLDLIRIAEEDREEAAQMLRAEREQLRVMVQRNTMLTEYIKELGADPDAAVESWRKKGYGVG